MRVKFDREPVLLEQSVFGCSVEETGINPAFISVSSQVFAAFALPLGELLTVEHLVPGEWTVLAIVEQNVQLAVVQVFPEEWHI